MQRQAVCLLHKLPRQVAYCLRCCIGGGEAGCGGEEVQKLKYS